MTPTEHGSASEDSVTPDEHDSVTPVDNVSVTAVGCSCVAILSAYSLP